MLHNRFMYIIGVRVLTRIFLAGYSGTTAESVHCLGELCEKFVFVYSLLKLQWQDTL